MSNLDISKAIRLDQYVTNELGPRISRSYASKLIQAGKVYVNAVPVTKIGYKLKTDDIVDIDFDISEYTDAPEIDLPIIYEGQDYVVINKPIGVLAHSKGEANDEGTVATWLRQKLALENSLHHFTDEEGHVNNRAGIVHRLDRATSGIMICAKNTKTLSWLQKQFSERKVKKTYIALVRGHFEVDEAVIDMPIERNPKAPATFRTGPNGKKATTTYRVLKTSKHYSLVELKPLTGRTHQLRVHLSKVGHPIVGDLLYGGEEADRMYLHALSLELTVPNTSRAIFESMLPDEFENKLKNDKQ